jgi:nicotinamidase-related amidase
MDLQQNIVGRVTDPDYLPRVAGALAAARRTGVAVGHVVIGFRPGQPDVNPANPVFNAIPPTAFTPDDPGAAVHPSVAPQPGDLIITKKRVSAFTGSDLELVLRSTGVTHLVLTGVATSGVVLSTLRQAADLDYHVTVLADGCFDADPEVHRVLTEKVFPRQAEVTTIAEWTASLS